MYFKTEDLKHVINNSTLSDRDKLERLYGMAYPFKTYTQEEVDQEQAKAATDQAKGEELKNEEKEKTFGFFGILQDLAEELKKNGHSIPPFPFPPDPFGSSFSDFMHNMRNDFSKHSIEIKYTADQAKFLAQGSASAAVEAIQVDFVAKFKEKYNGMPSPVLMDEVTKNITGTLKRYKSDTLANFYKGLVITLVLPPKVGQCNCDACTVTPLTTN